MTTSTNVLDSSLKVQMKVYFGFHASAKPASAASGWHTRKQNMQAYLQLEEASWKNKQTSFSAQESSSSCKAVIWYNATQTSICFQIL